MERGEGLTGKKAGWVARLLYRAMRRRIGRVPKAATLKAHDTSLMLASTWMDAYSAAGKTIPTTLKELVQLKVAAMVGCPF